MKERLKADLALAGCSLLWGATFVVVKEALSFASVFVFMALRFGLAAVLMALMLRSTVRSLRRADWVAGAQVGFFLFAGYAFQNAGMLYTTPSKAAFITGSGVVLVPVLMAVFWKRSIHAWAWVGAVVAMAGLYFLTVPPGAGAQGFTELNRGDVLACVCAVMFALHIIFVGRYSSGHSVSALSLTQIVATGAMSAVAIPVFALGGLEAPRLVWNGSLVFGVLLTAVGATAIAFSVQVWAQQHTTPAHTAILVSLEAVFAGLTSFVVAGERLSGRALLGAALIFAGILLAELLGPSQAAVDSPGPVTDSG